MPHTWQAQDGAYLRQALQEARAAGAAGEVPVGAVLVQGGQVIATGRNACIAQHDASAHAEIVALRAAGQALGNYRLSDCELFVSLEPCAMCAGALAHARIRRVVFGLADPRTGAAGSVLNVLQNSGIGAAIPAINAQDAADCDADLKRELRELLPQFFQAKRQAQAQRPWPLRPDALRAPDAVWAEFDAEGSPWPPAQFCNDLPSLGGLRLHFWDSGAPAAASQPPLLGLHSAAHWAYVFAPLLRQMQGQRRVLLPDLLGFGRSDKPKKAAHWTAAAQVQVLRELTQQQLGEAALAAGGLQLAVYEAQHPLLPAIQSHWPEALALPLLQLPAPPTDARLDALPFADAGHRAMQRAWQMGQKPA